MFFFIFFLVFLQVLVVLTTIMDEKKHFFEFKSNYYYQKIILLNSASVDIFRSSWFDRKSGNRPFFKRSDITAIRDPCATADIRTAERFSQYPGILWSQSDEH